MRLLHYSRKPFHGPVYSTNVSAAATGVHKPRAFWVSVEGECDWPSWCESEHCGLDRLAHVSEITLAPDANVRVISNEAEFDDFHSSMPMRTLYPGQRADRDYLSPDWPEIAKTTDGLIIAPYLWGRRMGPIWYYGWDCASGCIWHSRAIGKVTYLGPYERKTSLDMDGAA